MVPLGGLAFYWRTLGGWFMQDDFTFLSLHTLISKPADLLPVLLKPIAQGTIRPLSDRLFFFTLERVFGYNAVPFHVVIMATFWALAVLLGLLVWRLSGSRWAAFLAMLLWAAHSAVAEPLIWISAYNQLQWPLLALAALHCRLTALQRNPRPAGAEDGAAPAAGEPIGKGNRKLRRRWLLAELLLFLLGFLSLELNVVYPVLAAGLTLLVSRRQAETALQPDIVPAGGAKPGATPQESPADRLLASFAALLPTLPLFLLSALYYLLHRTVSAGMNQGIYQQNLSPTSLLHTLWAYLPFLSGSAWHELGKSWMEITGQATIVAMAAVALWALYQRHGLALWGLLFFACTLGPLLTLPHHITRYYLCTPMLGLATAAACAVRETFAPSRMAAGRRSWEWPLLSSCLVAAYLVTSLYSGYHIVEFHRARSRTAQRLVLACQEFALRHPAKRFLLAGVTSDQYWAALNDGPFRLFPDLTVRLAPGAARAIEAHPEVGDPASQELPPAEAAEWVDSGNALVVHTGGERLRNVTPEAEAEWVPQWRQANR